MQNLNLNHNQIITLPENVFNSLTQLEQLGLEYNKIENLPKNIFNDVHILHEIMLSENSLTTLPFSITKLNYLERLELYNNPLSITSPIIRRWYNELAYNNYVYGSIYSDF